MGRNKTIPSKKQYIKFVAFLVHYSSLCEVNVEYYPFDVQTCELVYHVPSGTLDTVYLNGPDFVPDVELFPNAEWRIVKTSTIVDGSKNTNVVFIRITVQRRAEFTVYTMIIPLATLALVNVFTFLVPIDSGEKGSLSITLFLAYGFFATVTRDSLPHNSVQISYYIVYVTTLLIFSVFTIVYVIIESKIYSSIGSSKCNIFKSNANVMSPRHSQPNSEEKDEPVNETLVDKVITWNQILKKADMIVFFLSLLTLIIFSFLLWMYVVQKSKFHS